MKIKNLLLICFLACTSVISAQQIDQICPPNWFIGMRDSSVQLLIHGTGIGNYDLKINYPGVRLVAVTRVENKNYLFADLVIDKTARPGAVDLYFSAGKKSFTKQWALQARAPWTNTYGLDAGDLIYLLMPDRFANGDTTNDVVASMNETISDRKDPKGRHGGDIAGIMQHLDYISKLGATAVWCTPLVENNEPKWSYHGYAITDHYKIDPRFGNNQQYAEFVQSAHKHNLKVVVDLVHNHVGDQHWFIKDLPMPDWIHQWDTSFVRSNYRTSVKNDPYASAYDVKKMNEGWFDKHMPDLNQENPYLAKYIIQNNIWWIETYHVDGFRLDTYPYSDLSFLQDWGVAIQKEYPGFGIFGEVWVNGVGVQGYFHGDNHINDGFNSHLPGVTDFNLYDATTTGLNENFGWYEGMTRIYHNLTQDYLYGDVMKNVVFLGNHDLSRFYSVMGESPEKFKLGVAFAMTTRGMVQWYYGDEILMKNFSFPEDGLVREDFPGGWKSDGTNKFDPQNLAGKEKEIFNYVSGLANWRKNSDAIKYGKLMQFIPENGVYVYFRYTEKETIMIVLNSASTEYTLDTKRFAERIGNFTIAQDVVTKQNNTIAGLKVAAKSPGVYVLK
ncbi:MAG TPA: glycoside hydrolase family 13 protein [Chitinophagales bacterium]|nr:glycoside hydrolase family 13 protein [Chitinophagales bacterium]